MKKPLLALFLILFFLFFFDKANAQYTVSNGASTGPINFPAGSCTYTWTNNNTSIGLNANGTGNIPSFTAINTGSSPVTATITGTPIAASLAYVANTDGNVSVINTASNLVVAQIQVGSQPWGVATSQDGQRVYVSNSGSNSVSVINTSTNSVITNITVGSSPHGIAVSPNGSRVYVANTGPSYFSTTGPNSVSVINTATNTVVATIPVGTDPIGVVVSPDGSRVYVLNVFSNTVSVINTATNGVIASIAAGAESWGITISPNGNFLYVACPGSNTVSVISTATNMVTASIPVAGSPAGITVSPDGSRLYVTNAASSTLTVINTANNTQVGLIPVDSSPCGVSVSPDGKQVYVADYNSNDIAVINTATNTRSATIPQGSTSYSMGNFISPGPGCNGSPVTFTITVNPSVPTITTTAVTGTISACAGTASASPNIQQFTVSGSGLTGNITATAPTGFEVSLASGSGYGNSVAIPQIAGTVSSTVVYVRSAATAPVGSISGNVTLTSAGAGSQTVAVKGTVNALPTVNAVANQTVNAGATTAAVNFTGSGNTFTWVNDTPGIGLAASGTGDIASFTAVNTGSSSVKATITVTPASVGYIYIAITGLNEVQVINTVTNSIVASIPTERYPTGVSVSPDGSTVYVADQNPGGPGNVSVINTSTNTVTATIPVGLSPWGIVTNPNGKWVYVVNQASNTVSVISAATNTVLTTIPVAPGPGCVAVSQDGSRVYVAGAYGSNSNAVVINTLTNTVIATIPIPQSSPWAIAVSPDGSRVYIADPGQNSVHVINTLTNILIANIPVGAFPDGVVVTPDGKSVYIADSYGGVISLIDAVTNSLIANISSFPNPEGVSISPDGKNLYVVNTNSGKVSVFDTQSNALIKTLNYDSHSFSATIGNFLRSGTGCPGNPITFTITINPTIPTITATTATGAISACAGTASASPNIQQFKVSGSGLTGNITATAPTNFEISRAAGSGYSNSVTIPQTAGSVSNTVVYVRSAATASVGSISGNVTLTSAGAGNQTVAVKGTVNALPTVNAVTNQLVANGATTTAVNFTGTGNTFTWVNDTPGIGLAASGSGDIASFTAVNTGGSPVKATITVTPVNAGFAYIANQGDGSSLFGSVDVINTVTNTVVANVQVGINPFAIAVSPDGSRVYVTNTGSNTVSVINALTNTVSATINVGQTPQGVAVSPDGSRVYVSNGNSSTVSVINTANNMVVSNIAVGSNPWGVKVNPNGTEVYVTNNASNTVSVISTATNAVIATIAVGLNPAGLTTSPDGSTLYVANYVSRSISVISTSNNLVITTISAGCATNEIAISPDGAALYVADYSYGSVEVFDTATNYLSATITGVGTEPESLFVTPDGREVYVTNADDFVCIINTATDATSRIDIKNSQFSFGNFISSSGCSGIPVTFTITVNPSSPTITTSTATGTISACAGSASASPQIQQFTVSGSGLTGNITATAPTNFEISLAAGSGYSNSLTITQAGGAVNSTIIYVRSIATAPAGSISGNVTLTSAGAASQTVAVTGMVKALPTVNPVANQNVNTGATTTAVNFTGTANSYSWVNDSPGIGLAASGTGDIASFTAVNNGNTPITATITATPTTIVGFAYVPNSGDGTVSVVNTTTKTVVSTIQVGAFPFGVAASADGTRVYITNENSKSVSVINTADNTVVATITVGNAPSGAAVSPDGTRVYIANYLDNTVSVINTLTNSVLSTVTVGPQPLGVSVSPDGSYVYVANSFSNTVSVIRTATNTVSATITVGLHPFGICFSPDGSKAYIANHDAQNVAVINTASNNVTATINVGSAPYGICSSRDGKNVYVANLGDNTVSVINTALNSVTATIPVGALPYGVSTSPDGNSVYVVTRGTNSISTINTATNSISASVTVGSTPYSFGNFIAGPTGCPGVPGSFTITVNPGPPVITGGVVTGIISACAGMPSASPNIQQFTVSGSGLTGKITATAPTGFEISLAAASGYGSSVTIPQSAGMANNTVIYVRSAAGASSGSISGNVTLTSAGAGNQIVAVAGTINTTVAPSLVIAASGNNICAGTPVIFIATPTNGGSVPVYQWLVNGNNAGTNSPTFSSSTLANGDVVSCMMTSNYACAAPANATSNSIIMNVIADVVPSVSILASQKAICTGTPVTFTATPINGGVAPVYQWLVNGNNAGTNSPTFGSSNLADGDIVSCVLTSNAGCAAPVNATSNSITMGVSSALSPSISITASQNNICPGTNITFTATPTNGGGSPAYQWLLNGAGTGVNSATFASSTLSNGDVISCRLISNAACLTAPDATSNSITIIVNAQAAPSVSIAISANNVCAGAAVTFTASSTYGGSSPVYQWLVNGSNAGSNSPTFSSSTFANGDAVTCVMTSNLACAVPATATSNSITTNIFPLPSVNGGGNKTIEKGSSVALTATASGDIADITWSPATGLDNSKILTPQASPVATTLYTVTVQTVGGCIATDEVTVTVLDGIVIPNTFTPNGDGVNDKWDIQNLRDYQNSEVKVFDRYGGEVYRSKGYYTAWDGTENGLPLPVGTYYYLINLNNGTRPLSGFVALIR